MNARPPVSESLTATSCRVRDANGLSSRKASRALRADARSMVFVGPANLAHPCNRVLWRRCFRRTIANMEGLLHYG